MRLERPRDRLRAEEGAAQVHVEDEVEVLLAHVEQRLVAQDAGVVHQHVDVAVLVQRGPDQAVRAFARRDAVVIRGRLAARRFDVGDGLVSHLAALAAAMAVRPEIVHHHLRAFVREGERVLAADAAAGSGDDRDLPLQETRHGCLRRKWRCLAGAANGGNDRQRRNDAARGATW